MAEFTPITSQEQLDAILKDRLERANKKFDGFISPSEYAEKTKALEQKITDLTNTVSAEAKKHEDLEKDLAESNAKIKGFEVGALKTRIAHENGLSYEAISYLSGDTEEAIKSSAEGLKKLMGSTKAPDFNPDISNKNHENDSLRNLAKGLGSN